MLAALRGGPASLPAGQLRSWLASIAVRIRADRWRSAARSADREAEVVRLSADHAEDSPIDRIERATLRKTLRESVPALDAGTRDAILLFYFEGLDHRTVGERLGITEAASQKRVSRGLERLRKSLREAESDDRALWSLATAAFLPSCRASAMASRPFLIAKVAALLVVGGPLAWTAATMLRSEPAEATQTNTVLASPSAPRTGEPGESPRTTLAEPSEVANRAAISRHRGTNAGLDEESVAAYPGPAAGEGAALEVQILWADTRAPVRGEPVTLLPFGAPDPFLFSTSAVTDDAGRVAWGNLYPGAMRVGSARGLDGTLERGRGESAVGTLLLDRGARIHGVVTDGDGQPVGGAVLEISQTTGAHRLSKIPFC